MKILYGVQATGNGHITRARSLAPYLASAGHDVQYLFSGRERSELFDMQCFGDFQCRKGFTFQIDNGRINIPGTARRLDFPQFARDVTALEVRDYDMILSDFEPVCAWAAKLRGVTSISIGHQSAFRYKIPTKGHNILSRMVMRLFAPANVSVGFHWHHFGYPVLPPLLDFAHLATEFAVEQNRILVYLPLESELPVISLLQQFPRYQFVCYRQVKEEQHFANVRVRPLSTVTFREDFARASGVIANAGFALGSEALHAGKKLLVKPLEGQAEQLTNAYTLELLSLGQVMNTLDYSAVSGWLEAPAPQPLRFPNVAEEFVQWLGRGKLDDLQSLADHLWSRTASVA